MQYLCVAVYTIHYTVDCAVAGCASPHNTLIMHDMVFIESVTKLINSLRRNQNQTINWMHTYRPQA